MRVSGFLRELPGASLPCVLVNRWCIMPGDRARKAIAVKLSSGTMTGS